MAIETIAILKCDGFDHLLKVDVDREDGLVYFGIYIDGYYGRQVSIFERLRERAKIIWAVARGKEFLFDEIMVPLEDTQQLVKLMPFGAWMIPSSSVLVDENLK